MGCRRVEVSLFSGISFWNVLVPGRGPKLLPRWPKLLPWAKTTPMRGPQLLPQGGQTSSPECPKPLPWGQNYSPGLKLLPGGKTTTWGQNYCPRCQNYSPVGPKLLPQGAKTNSPVGPKLLPGGQNYSSRGQNYSPEEPKLLHQRCHSMGMKGCCAFWHIPFYWNCSLMAPVKRGYMGHIPADCSYPNIWVCGVKMGQLWGPNGVGSKQGTLP